MTSTITGLFDTREAAEAAIEHLKRHDGVSPDRIHMHGQGMSSGPMPEAEEHGFWASLKSLFLPDEDRAVYSEGIRRGGIVVSAELDDGMLDHAISVFEQNGAVDLDAREVEWRSSGWTGYDAGSSAPAPGVAYVPGGMGLAASGVTGAGTGPGAGTSSTGAARGMDTSGGMTGGVPAGSGIAASGEAARTASGASPITGSDMPGTGRAETGTGSIGNAKVGGTADTRTSDIGTPRAGLAGTGKAETGKAGMGAASATDRDVLPVVEEQLRVGKRDAERGSVRVRSYVVERPVTEEVSLRSEHVNVERRPVDRALTGEDDAFRERTIEAVEHSEEAVVSKEARVVEEVAVTKDVSERTETVRDTVRRQDVKVEDSRTPGTGPMPRNPA